MRNTRLITAAVMCFVKSGKLCGLAAAASRRLNSLPDLPAVSEVGVPGFVMLSWYGVL